MINSILDMVGNTPLLHIPKTNIFVKLECFNPTGSIKDRIAKQMIVEAIRKGQIKKDSILIEPTSGNTGIGIAALGRALGYRVVIVMPDTMSEERKKLLKVYGAELILTEGKKGMKGAIERALEFAQEFPNAIILNQFDNQSNPNAHYLTTGPEIWRDMEKDVDILIVGIGTGGTIMGTGRYLKEKNPNLKIIGVEPASSPLLTKGYAGIHHIEGIGAGFIPSILDVSFIDEILAISEVEAIEAARDFVKQEGLFVGISSGAVLFAAYKLSKNFPNQKIVAILP
ncbi:MAG: cysteine synthase A, partial [Roseburia sp.]|nr:cysteine synthase A [Roseburia sp.]